VVGYWYAQGETMVANVLTRQLPAQSAHAQTHQGVCIACSKL